MLNRVTVLVRNDIRVFAVIHASITEVNRVVAGGVEGLVGGIPVGMGQRGKIPDTVHRAHVIVETEGVEAPLNRIDRMVDRHLFESAIRAVVVIDPADFVGIGHAKSTRQAYEIHKLAFEGSHTGIEPQESDRDAGCIQRGGRGVGVVCEPQISGCLHRVRAIDHSRSGIESDAVLL